jgi:AcrR family transcriptional regulator
VEYESSAQISAQTSGPSEGGAVPPNDPSLTADLTTLVREPQQARSRKTLGRLVEAAHTLLSREGPDGLTVTGIAKRAGASVGSFYARFDGKEELIRYVGEAALAEALGNWSQALESALSEAEQADGTGPVGSPVAGISRHLLDAFRSGPARRLRALDGLEDPSPSRLERYERQVGGDLERVFQEREGAPEQRARVAALVTLAALQAAADHEELASPAEEIAGLLGLYLGSAEAPRRQPQPEARERAAARPPAQEAAKSEAEEPSEPTPEEEAAPAPEKTEDDAPADDEVVDLFDVWG